jgi:hypothetical protein
MPTTQQQQTKAPARVVSEQDLADLRWAHRHLEHPSLAAQLSNLVGSSIESGFKLLPKPWYQRLQSTAELSVRRSLDLAVSTIEPVPSKTSQLGFHKAMVMGTGAAGGFFGLAGLLAELPVTTTLMLRSITDIAREQGEDLGKVETRLACVQVFALGASSREDEAAETRYYGLRALVGFHFSDILDYTSGKQIAVPGGLNIVRAIAARFGLVISDKAAAQMVPFAAAFSGAFLNLIFMQHFQDVACGHFIVRRLERKYGAGMIKAAYERLRKAERRREKEFSPLEGW